VPYCTLSSPLPLSPPSLPLSPLASLPLSSPPLPPPSLPPYTPSSPIISPRVGRLEEAVAEFKLTRVVVETIQTQLDRVYTELDMLIQKEGNSTAEQTPPRNVARNSTTPSIADPAGKTTPTKLLVAPPAPSPTLKRANKVSSTAGSSDVEGVTNAKTPPTTDPTGNRGVVMTNVTPTTPPVTPGDATPELHNRNKALLSCMKTADVSGSGGGGGGGELVLMRAVVLTEQRLQLIKGSNWPAITP
jgi:hypothetical protein